MKLPQNTLSQLKSLRVLIDMKELEIQALKGHIATLLLDSVGVDIRKSDWVLDLDIGELREPGEAHD